MAEKDRDRYCTPPPIAFLQRRQFRGLADLDPCHDPSGLTLARVNYDIRRGQDGLALPWRGKVWLNPPYSLPAPWLERAALHYRYGLAETLAIVNVQSGSRYWHRWVWPCASAICFLESRVAFWYDGRPENGNRYDQAVIYYGDDVGRFRSIWSSEGAIVRPPRPLLTGRSPRSNLAAMMDETLHEMDDQGPNLLQVLGPAVIYTIYAQVKHMTIEEVVEATLPYLEDFINGYQFGRASAERDDDDGVTFDDPPADFGANGRDPNPPKPRSRKKPAKKKKAAKKSATKKAATKKAPKAKAAAPKPPSPSQSTSQLDEHVLSLLKAKGQWTPSRDLKPLVRGVNDNQLRKSLARLVSAGLAVSEGATKSKVYMAS